MAMSVGAPSHYEWQSMKYRAKFRDRSSEELRAIKKDSRAYLDNIRGFARVRDILFGGYDDQRARNKVASSILEERAH